MFNSTKVRASLAALAIAVTALSGIATASAAGKADSKVSIKGNDGDYYGYVKSSSEAYCANARTVKVFKQLGPTQDPKDDMKIGTDTASADGSSGRYLWEIGNSGYKSGKFYAKVGKTDYCKSATSKTITR